MWRILFQQNPQLNAFQARFNPQSLWALRWAVFTGLIVVVIPAIVLVLAALLVGMCVYFILLTLARVGALFGMGMGIGQNENRPTPDDVGLRQNVRVMDDE